MSKQVLVMADIHGNLEALKAVLKDSAGEYRETWVLGDIAGYGPDPGSCLDILKNVDALMIAGNHDLAVCGKIDMENFNLEARAALEIHRKQLSERQKSILAQLPQKVIRHSVTLSHGNPADPIWGYVLDNHTAGAVLKQARTSLTLIGHSHINGYWMSSPENHAIRGDVEYGADTSYAGTPHLANPGSVGQSRDDGHWARYMLLNPWRKTMIFRQCRWKGHALRRKMVSRGYPLSLIKRMVP